MNRYSKEFDTTPEGCNRSLYQCWSDMRRRCSARAHTKSDHKNYFMAGITVCEEWMDWPSFAQWARDNGYSQGLEIDRRDNSKGYSPDNCRFITHLENVRNKDKKKCSASSRIASRKQHARPFICQETGDLFFNQQDAIKKFGIKSAGTIHRALHGKETRLKYTFDYIYPDIKSA